MEERSECEKMDEVMLPGFRFHPTDEELVGFYLKRKVQQRPLSIELIKQLDIYKYDPWDLPKLATSTGEKEWYFYCPRDRKYRNSTRPNRVTGAGFWKATGTDRPIYSSDHGSKCIGLKKSLVFYRGRAAKGIKTDWMMHEFRLPPLSNTTTTESVAPQKRFMDRNIPANDSWAICRIFKKANSSAQRAISHSWVSPLPQTTTTTTSHETLTQGPQSNFTSVNMSTSSSIQFSHNNDLQQSCITSFSPSYAPTNHIATTKPPHQLSISSENLPTSFPFSSSIEPFNVFGDFFGKTSETIDFSNGFSLTLPQEMHTNGIIRRHETAGLMNGTNFDDQWGGIMKSTNGISLMSLPLSSMPAGEEAWKQNLVWDSSPCPSDQLSTGYSTNKCYT